MQRVLMTVEEVAEYCRIPLGTLRSLRQEGRFAPAIKVGRRLVFDASDVDAWLDAHKDVAS